MSAIFNVLELTDSNKKQIIKDLSIVPVDAREKKLNERGIFSKPGNNTKEPIMLFHPNAETKTLLLPYFYAKTVTGNKKINYKPEHENVFDSHHLFAIQLRPEQTEICDEALMLLKRHNTVTLGLYPSAGKTIMGSFLAYVKGYMPLVLLSITSLMNSWLETFKMCFPWLEDRIWVVNEKTSPWNPKKRTDTPAIIICMKDRVKHIPDVIRFKVGTLIIDEAHKLCTPSCVESLLYFHPRFIIIETATLNRDDETEHMMHKIAGEHAINREDPRPYKFIRIKTGVQCENFKNKMGGLDSTKIYQALCESPERNNQIINIVKSNLHHKYIILTKYREHVAVLCKLLTEAGIDNDFLIGGESDYQDSTVLVGTIPKMGTGFDEKMYCSSFKGRPSNVLILCCTTPTIALLVQLKGRVMRSDNPIIIWPEDNVPMVKSHTTSVKPFVIKYGTFITTNYSNNLQIDSLNEGDKERKKNTPSTIESIMASRLEEAGKKS